MEGNIYIPPCRNKQCQSWILKIAEALKDHADCIIKHNINGPFRYHLEKYLDGCDFVILHHCVDLWRRISKHLDYLYKHEDKLILVHFVGKDGAEVVSEEEDSLDLQRFFTDFDSTRDLTDDTADLQCFKDEVVACLPHNPSQGEDIATRDSFTTAQISDREEDGEMEVNIIDTKDNEIVTYEKYQRYFENKFHLPMLIKQKLAPVELCKEISFDQKDFHSLKKAVQQINYLDHRSSKKEEVSCLEYLMNTTLPKFYEEYDIVRLACLSMCTHAHIQERALDLLEILLWRKEDSVKDFKQLIDVEAVLHPAILELKDKCEASNDVGYLIMLQRVVNVYLLVIGSLIIQSQETPEVYSKCENFLITRSAVLFSTKPCQEEELFDPKKQIEANVCLSILNNVMTGATKIKQVLKSAENYLTKQENPQGKLTKKSTVHLIVTIQLLRKVFLLDKLAVQDILGYVTKFRGKTQAVYMILHSLTLFLLYKFQQSSHEDMSPIVEQICYVIQMTITPEPVKQIDDFLQRLLFCEVQFIRQSIIKTFDITDRYGICMVDYLQNEMKQLLSPLLCEFKLIPAQNSDGYGWKKANGLLQEKKVWIYFYFMTQRDHKIGKTDFKENENFQFTEMKHLANLQHKNIIKMFAYQHECIPQFYVLENCPQTLQIILKNKRKIEHFYKASTLLHFLRDAARGLHFCHSQGYVHCNLTADSLIIGDGNQVKLSAFGLCKKIEDSTGKAMEVNSKSIPRRWSAPESIFEGVYSNASDVWMFGHLLYEVMTHGLLPYSNIKKTDEEVIELLQSKSVRLIIEPSVEKKAIQQLLAACVSYDSEQRTYAANIEATLNNILMRTDQMDQKNTIYPALTEESMSSTNYKRGVPEKFHKRTSKKNPPNIRQTINISESVDQIIHGDGEFVFKEKIYERPSSALESFFLSPLLDNILPQKRHFVQYSDEMPFIECSIPSENCFSLLKVALCKKVEDRKQIILFIFQVASILKDLAKHSCIIGDLCASHIYVELLDVPKVHIISLAYLNKLSSSEDEIQSSKLFANAPGNMKRRAAPEVLESRSFSAASDVFCFGNFMWELLTAFEYGDPMTQIKIFNGVEGKDIYAKIVEGQWETKHPKPKSCELNLYELIKSCVSVRSIERPTISHVAVKLGELCGMPCVDQDEDDSAMLLSHTLGSTHNLNGQADRRSLISDDSVGLPALPVSGLIVNNPSIYSGMTGSSVNSSDSRDDLSIANFSSSHSNASSEI